MKQHDLANDTRHQRPALDANLQLSGGVQRRTNSRHGVDDVQAHSHCSIGLHVEVANGFYFFQDTAIRDAIELTQQLSRKW